MGAGALTICHNKTAVQVKEDMKKIVQIPILRPRAVAAKHTKLFGASLFELCEKGLIEDGVPLVVQKMVEYLSKHALHQEGLFRINGNVRAVETLKHRLESGEDVDLFSESDTCTVASLLKQYLRDLPQGLVDSTVQQALIQHHQECSDDGSWSDMRDLIQQLPDVHHSLLRYLCQFLTLVECNHKDNRMTAFNLATVFGPSVFHVAPGFEALKDQNICNKIMVKFIQNYGNIFETNVNKEGCTEEPSTIIFKEVDVTDADVKESPSHLNAKTPTPVPRTKAGLINPPENAEGLTKPTTNTPKARPRKKKVRKGKSDGMPQVVPQPSRSTRLPYARPLSIPIVLPLTSGHRSPSPEAMETSSVPLTRKDTPDTSSHLSLDVSPSGSTEGLGSSQEEERPISPFYMSNHLFPVHCRPDVVKSFLDRTIRSTVEQHLFDVNPLGEESSEDSELTSSPRVTPTARQRRRHQREQHLQEEGLRHRERNRAASVRANTNKENIPSSGGSSSGTAGEDTSSSADSQGGQGGHAERTLKPRKSKHIPSLVQLTDNQDARALNEGVSVSGPYERPGTNHMETFKNGNDTSRKEDLPSPPQGPTKGPTKGLKGPTGDTKRCAEYNHAAYSSTNVEEYFQSSQMDSSSSSGRSSRHQHIVPLSGHLEPTWGNSDRSPVQVCSLAGHRSLSALFLSLMVVQTLRMKIQESPVTCDTGRVGGEVRGSDPDCEKTSCEDVPRLDLTALTEDSNWGDSSFFNSPFLDFKSIFHQSVCDEPVPAYSPLQRESMDREEARLSPHAGGRLIRQLLEEDSDPMVSPRFYAYGQCQQYLDDTEVPPSPPNAHSFVSRRRSSSLGSCDDEKEELTSAQLTKRIHVLKKKIHKFEERFEEERKYRPSHGDKVGNPEVLRWVNELAKLRKDLKEHKLLKSEEDLPPLTRQRSNTLPKSFGSQLEKKPQQEKVQKPPVESTLETILKKLQEKREEVNRPEDIKDMTREQIGAEKVALQKALLYYESIHSRPVSKSERQIMKPLYDRYRLVKQILCRASTIPVIGSPSSKRRGPLLQPIIEGETALFFDDIKEEEDGSEDEGDTKTQFTVTVRPDISVVSFLDHMDEESDGFISPVDELSPSKNTIDMRLSNLHSATTQELVEQLQETREEKKRIRKNLKDFEDQFLRQNGRNVQKEDRSPLAVEYNEYKHVKAKLRLLEVLISKRDSSKFI
ncbi:protein FAM13A [Scomber scombrus]|uniref:protein FAM13A n=1 Tax=Scomber scombrus TaxID=13677 RepID=UPI002DDA85B4|nr:protein FAM13A [Scomber scombrus]